ncbi:CAP domain-containing protein [Chelativorans sp. ZYF759]|uniref:CAP domain-containing protein n=1 Tax=Chelativorans sp. ZYF759 TaxID=2692213 RepID=UPI00145E71D2|nr:CAP domain-containing protein [Chelativorans sp. ZYF759]NMG41763.1 CAP domain-containing protein [Chelativorans sp. ZYF759]
MNQPLPRPIRRTAVLATLMTCLLALASCQSIFAGIGGPSGTVASAQAAASVAEIRAANGLPPLRPDRDLERAALAQASNMASAGRMAHNTGTRRDFPSRMRAGGIRGTAAENIAHGRFDTGRVINVWMNSAGHRRNMLDERFSRFGLAYVLDPGDGGRRYWAMVLSE